jgi:hypothetical protein
MRLRVVRVWDSLARTSTRWPFSGLPWVSSATALSVTSPRALAQWLLRSPSTTADGQVATRVLTVCVSPLGSA